MIVLPPHRQSGNRFMSRHQSGSNFAVLSEPHLSLVLGLLTFFFNPNLVAIEKPEPKNLPVVEVKDVEAKTPGEMKVYEDKIRHSRVTIKMVPIPGGKFTMGSPESEAERREEEGPQHDVEIAPFWMSECEITWNAYEIFMLSTDKLRIEVLELETDIRDDFVDTITRPTKPYTDMTFGMGKRDRPAICMTQHAARKFCEWLSAKTGRYYRLPTEAEWEYACRAGTKTAYHFGDDPGKLGEYAWFKDNTEKQYMKVRQKKPNPWGLYDMHGNVAEWVLDQYDEAGYSKHEAKNPLIIPETLYPRVVRGGSFRNSARNCRSARRFGSDEEWKEQDPQEPQSIWYHTEATWVGFRILRPFQEPSQQEKITKWSKSLPIQLDKEK